MRPIDDMLKAAQGKTRFHMPGHKGRLEAVSAALDMTELPDTDDLYAPFSGIAEAERLLARSAGARTGMTGLWRSRYSPLEAARRIWRISTG